MSKVFQYAVVRYVPDIIRDEAVNVGVLIKAVEGHRFECKFLPRSTTVRKLWPRADSALVKNFQQQLVVCAKDNNRSGTSVVLLKLIFLIGRVRSLTAIFNSPCRAP